MKNINPTTIICRTSGFSLFEMMTFVCILGIMITMAIPLFGNTEQVKQVAAQRNAQTFCTLAYSASVAGINVAAGTTEVEVVLERLVQGITITKGALKGREFKMPNISIADTKEASGFVHLEKGELVFGAAVNGDKTL